MGRKISFSCLKIFLPAFRVGNGASALSGLFHDLDIWNVLLNRRDNLIPVDAGEKV